MKTKEELNNLKQEFETLNKKLRELTEEELEQVSGGDGLPFACYICSLNSCEGCRYRNSGNYNMPFVEND